VQLATAEKPFVARELLADGNFITCCVFGFFIGILLYSTLALLPPLMQTLLGYPVAFTGLVSMPRGLGFTLPLDALHLVAAASCLQWVNSDGEKIAAVQAAIAAEPKPIRVPRERPPAVVLDEGPLVLVETRRDLSAMTLPFEQPPAA